MKTLALDAGDSAILDAVSEWASLLAEERYEDAYAFLYHVPGAMWTPQVLRDFFEDFGGVDLRPDSQLFQERPGGGMLPTQPPLAWFNQYGGTVRVHLPVRRARPTVEARMIFQVIDSALVLLLDRLRPD